MVLQDKPNVFLVHVRADDARREARWKKSKEEAGGLLSYGPNRAQAAPRIAYYIDKVLKGAKPADLPVETPTKFELVVNLNVAKQINLTIPPHVLARADKVIR